MTKTNSMNLIEIFEEKSISEWPKLLSISQSDFFADPQEYFDQEQLLSLRYSHVHFVGEVVMWQRSTYQNLAETKNTFVSKIDDIKKMFNVTEAICDIYAIQSKNFRKQFLLSYFKDKEFLLEVSHYLEIFFLPTKMTRIGDNEYRKLLAYRFDDKKEIATAMRKYHLIHFIENFTLL